MTAPTNLSFETAGASPGLADDWTTATTGAAAVLPDFGGGDPPSPVEGFESGWDTNADYLFALDPLAVTVPSFNTGANTTAYEDFEVEWDNSVYLFVLGSGQAVNFTGGGDAEGFETGWDTNEDYLFTLGPGDVTPCSFTGGDPHEDMEGGWQNDTYLTALSGTTAASFDEGAAAAERFIALIPPFSFSVSVSTIQAAGHGLTNGTRVKFRGGGLPPELIVGLTYYVVNAATNTFQVALTSGGSAVSMASASATTMQCYGDPAVCWTELYD